jgi:hypothetical protein
MSRGEQLRDVKQMPLNNHQCLTGSSSLSCETVEARFKDNTQNSYKLSTDELAHSLALGILRCLASPLESVFFAFFDSTIPGQQAFFTQHGFE